MSKCINPECVREGTVRLTVLDRFVGKVCEQCDRSIRTVSGGSWFGLGEPDDETNFEPGPLFPGAGSDWQQFMCKRCGATVTERWTPTNTNNRAAHDDWHDSQDGRIAALEQRQQAEDNYRWEQRDRGF